MRNTAIWFLLILFFLSGCSTTAESVAGLTYALSASSSPAASFANSTKNPTKNSTESSPLSSLSPLPSDSPAPAPAAAPVVTRASIAAVGDILIHNTVYQDALQKDGTYDFKPMFGRVRAMLQGPDIAVANQETVIGGKELGLSSYPMFNSPHEIGDALKDAGIDLVTTANNHAMDKGQKGILSATAYWNKIGLPYTGSFRSKEDRDRIRTMTKNGITFAFLAYTYGTNGIRIPEDKPYLVNLLNENLLKSDMARAKKMADVIVVSAHWGVENHTEPNAEQKALAQKLADFGADIVIGTHPHVLQPFEWIPRSDGRRTFVMYSLGNFLSAQVQLLQLIGGIGQVDVIKTVSDGKVSIRLKNPRFIPTYDKYSNYRNYRVTPMGEMDKKDYSAIAKAWTSMKKNMLKAMPDLLVEDGPINAQKQEQAKARAK